MKRKIPVVLCILIGLILSSCKPSSSSAPFPTVASSLASPTLAAFSAESINRITVQSSFGKGAITYSEFSPDTKQIGVVTPLGVYVYDLETLKQQLFIASDLPVRAAAFSPDWSLLAVGTGSTVTLRQLSDQKIVANLETQSGEISRLLFSPDGSLLASFVTPPGEEIYSQTVELWRISDQELLGTWVVSVYDATAFSTDGKTFSAWSLSGSQMEGVRRWQIPSGKHLSAWKDLNPYPVAFSQDGNLYAASASDGIVIQNVLAKTEMHKISIGNSQSVSSMRFSPDGSLLAAKTKEGLVQVWRIADETMLYSFDSGSSANLLVTISENNEILAIPTLDGIAFYSLINGSLMNRLSGHFSAIHQAVISPKGDKVAALVEGDGLIVWDLLKGHLAYSLSKVGAICLTWSPDGNSLALGGVDSNLHILRAEDGTTMRSITPHTGMIAQVQSIAFSPDGSLLASSTMNSIKLWQFSDGSLVRDIPVSGGWVTGVRFSSDEKFLAAIRADENIEVWQVNNGQSVAELSASVSSDSDVIAFAPSSDLLAIGVLNQIELWRFTEPKPFLSLPVGDAKINALRISPDGSLLACGLTDGSIQLWQIPEGKLLSTLKGGQQEIVSLQFSASGRILLSASQDGTIRIWKVVN